MLTHRRRLAMTNGTRRSITPDQLEQLLTDPLTTLVLRPFALLAMPGSPPPTTHPPSMHAPPPDWNVRVHGLDWWVADYDLELASWFAHRWPRSP
jgi:hypothetical protein